MVDNTVISKDNLEILLAVQVPPEKYRILKKAWGDWNRKYNHGDIDKRAETFEAFFNRFKKGSKIFKVCLKGNTTEHVPHNIVKYSKTTDLVIPLSLSTHLNVLWTKNFFELNVLKQEELKDNARINELERQLAKHIDFKVKREVTDHKKFEMLNNAKITPFFLNLVKGAKKEDPI